MTNPVFIEKRELNGFYVRRHPVGVIQVEQPDGTVGLNTTPVIAVHNEYATWLEKDGAQVQGTFSASAAKDTDFQDPDLIALQGEALVSTRALLADAVAGNAVLRQEIQQLNSKLSAQTAQMAQTQAILQGITSQIQAYNPNTVTPPNV